MSKDTAKVDRNRQRCPLYERKLRKVLGRLLELQRHTRLLGVGGHAPRDLVRLKRHIADTQIDGLVLGGTVEEMIAATTEALNTFCKKTRGDRFNEWCEAMRAGDRRVYKWIKGPTEHAGYHVHHEGDIEGRAAGSIGEALQLSVDYWRSWWDRATVDVAKALEFWKLGGVTTSETFVFREFDAEQLMKKARAGTGDAAGCDGWSGEECANFPREAWQIFAGIATKMIKKGQHPDSFRELRQVHIPKEGAKPRPKDGATSVAETRPIGIEACMWRIWVDSWALLSAHGGLPGRGVHTALFEVERRLEAGSILVSIDLEKAFDTDDPLLACEILRMLGMDPEVVALFFWIWSGQKRFVGMGGEVPSDVQRVSTSLPGRKEMPSRCWLCRQ